jgi:prepilin-type N-terminal cleavage/methylation domain-containing protein
MVVKNIAREKERSSGMTLVELLIVMILIGMLAGLTVLNVNSYRYTGRDAERTSDVESIARSFEISYLRDATANGPSYPTTQRATTVSGYGALFKGQSLDATKAPDTSANTSIVAATTTTKPQSPTKDQYIYLPLTATGNLCNSTDLCVRFLLYYRLESTGVVRVIESIHQQ